MRDGAERTAKAEEFRTYAAECEKLASETKNPDAKRRFEESAADWRKLAEIG